MLRYNILKVSVNNPFDSMKQKNEWTMNLGVKGLHSYIVMQKLEPNNYQTPLVKHILPLVKKNTKKIKKFNSSELKQIIYVL